MAGHTQARRLALCAALLACLAATAAPAAAQSRSQRQEQAGSRRHPGSPCPRVFTYEGDEAEPDRWYGTVMLATDEPLIGIRLDVQLDRPAKILGNWEGEVSTRDNVRYTILNLQTRLRPGPPRAVRIFVRYGERDPVPRLRSIALNGRRICPEDSATDSGTSGSRQTTRPPYVSSGGGGGGTSGGGSGVGGGGGGGGGGGSGVGGVVYEEPRPVRPSTGADPLNNEGGRYTTPRRPTDPYGNRRPVEPDPLSESGFQRPSSVDRDRTTRRPQVSVLPVGGVGSGDRRPPARPPADPFGSGNREDRTTRRTDPFDEDPYLNRRTTAATPLSSRRPATAAPLPFHNVWEEGEEGSRQPAGEATTRRPGPGQRPPDAEWITPDVGTAARPRPTAPTTTEGRRTTRQPQHDDGSVRCGTVTTQATPLVTNGQRTTRGQWPWHAALYQSKNIDLSYKCGGSLISRSTVVTAAHCVTTRPTDRPVEADSLLIFVGKYHLKLWSEGGVQDKQVSSVYVHPMYNSSTFNADIALLILSSPVDFTTFVRPVCLWGSANTDIQSLENTEGYVVGWGFDENGRVTEDLMMAKMPVVSQQTCLWSHPQFFSHFTSNRTYCAGFRNGTSVCNGDSGGGMVFPMTTRDGARIWQLRGIVSISVSKEDRVCDTSHYVVFTDVAKYLDWIRKYIK
ncbi:uncharacterized protein LOC126284636 isoform X1 [Schistocerca gregaria]|uniref:uncharacterized protein LOC126284636 isoform X1 n=1 Tax=Schistocerca gregaria TaxID=7010 RepID=UPI00211DE963|nr:uncharacterized protein LOC126284636 isoform X1 [Schistocerca gregaria]